jgi:hypothetical protein
MKLSLRALLLPVAFIAPLFFAGCGKKHDDHAPRATTSGGHGHAAPHGGLLVEIGAHQYNLEFVRDPVAGKLTAYALDGHAEHFVRLVQPEIELSVRRGDIGTTLVLKAVANPATGETVGDTSQFEGTAEWLQGSIPFDATVQSVTFRGTTFENVRFTWKQAEARAADHEKHPRTQHTP